MKAIVKSFYASANVRNNDNCVFEIRTLNRWSTILKVFVFGIWRLHYLPIFKLGKIDKFFYLRGKGFLNFIYLVTEFREPFLIRGFIWKSYSYTEFANW